MNAASSTIGGVTTLPAIARPVAAGALAAVLEHVAVGTRHMRLSLHAPTIAGTAMPGQFVMLTVARRGGDTPVLPRPMAIYSTDPASGTIGIVYAVRGAGTRLLADHSPGGEPIYVVGPLGRGFDIPKTVESVLLVGRGIGVCSLTTVAQSGAVCGFRTIAVTSARTSADLIGREVFESAGAEALYEVTDTAGDSRPDRLFDRLTADWDDDPPGLVLTCGSDRLAALSFRLAERWHGSAQVSLEAHMACGLGYCHGCATGTAEAEEESPLICVDGPAFQLGT